MLSLKLTHGAGSHSLRSLLPLGMPLGARDAHFHLWPVALRILWPRDGAQAYRGASVHLLVLKVWSIAAVWCLVAIILGPWGRLERESDCGWHWPRGWKNWMQIVLFACIFFSVDEKTQIWAAPAVCFSAFGFVWLQSTPAQKRWPIAPVGWLWAGIYPLTVAWPNQQRFDLALLVGGIGMALQGIVEIVRSLRPPADGSHSTLNFILRLFRPI